MKIIQNSFSFYLIVTAAFILPQTSFGRDKADVFPYQPDAEYLRNWGLEMINALPAYQRGFTGKGVTVAVIDSGLNIYHPEFANRISPALKNFGESLTPYDVSDVAANGMVQGHGTHVSGIIAAARDGVGMHGVAYDATILPLRAIIKGDKADFPYLEAMDYAAEAGAGVLNGSFGPPAGPDKYVFDPNNPKGSFIKNPNYTQLPYQPIYGPQLANLQYMLLKSVAEADVVMVFAAGNSFENQPVASAIPVGFGMYPLITPQNTASGMYKFIHDLTDMNDEKTYRFTDPADPSVADLDFSDLKGSIIAVVAVGPDKEIAAYSNHCGAAAEWCLAAPGGNDATRKDPDRQIYSTLPEGYGAYQGTSMAAPHVSGAAAVVRQAFPYMTARQVIETILTTATDIGPAEIYGKGLLNLGEAANGALNGPKEFRYNDVFDVNTQGYTSDWKNPISGTGGLIKRGEGQLRLTAANTYSGSTSVLGGVLVLNGENVSPVTVGGVGILSGTGSAGVTINEAGGEIAPGDGGFGRLTLQELREKGGSIVIKAKLGDDASLSDHLNVVGAISGEGGVKVTNQGGSGAQTDKGIKIISGGIASDANLHLLGDYKTKDEQQAVVGGAYSYVLQQKALDEALGREWYLKSTDAKGNPRYSPGLPIYNGIFQAIEPLNQLPTLQQRTGNHYGYNAHSAAVSELPSERSLKYGQLFWGRVQGGYDHYNAGRSVLGSRQNTNSFLMQAGIDGQLYEDEIGALIGGVTVQYGKARAKVASNHGDGRIDTEGYGLGANLTWYGENGFYLDGQAQAMWFQSNLHSHIVSLPLADDVKNFGHAVSVEAGRRIDIAPHWSITPQAQLYWTSLAGDQFTDPWGSSVTMRRHDGLKARVGVSANYNTDWRDVSGHVSRASFYTAVNFYKEFSGSSKLDLAGVRFDNRKDRTWGGVAAGGSYSWADGKYAIFGEGAVNTSLNNFGKSYALKASVGFRMKW